MLSTHKHKQTVLIESLMNQHKNSCRTYTVVNAVHEVIKFLGTSFRRRFFTGDSICTCLQLLLELVAVSIITTFIPQNFLWVLYMQDTM